MFFSMIHQSRWRPYIGLLRLIGRVLRGFEPTFLIDLRFSSHSKQGKVFLANKVIYPDLSDLPFPLFPSSLLQSSSPSTNLVFFFFPNFTFFFFFFFRPFPPLRPAKKNSLASTSPSYGNFSFLKIIANSISYSRTLRVPLYGLQRGAVGHLLLDQAVKGLQDLVQQKAIRHLLLFFSHKIFEPGSVAPAAPAPHPAS